MYIGSILVGFRESTSPFVAAVSPVGLGSWPLWWRLLLAGAGGAFLLRRGGWFAAGFEGKWKKNFVLGKGGFAMLLRWWVEVKDVWIRWGRRWGSSMGVVPRNLLVWWLSSGWFCGLGFVEWWLAVICSCKWSIVLVWWWEVTGKCFPGFVLEERWMYSVTMWVGDEEVLWLFVFWWMDKLGPFAVGFRNKCWYVWVLDSVKAGLLTGCSILGAPAVQNPMFGGLSGGLTECVSVVSRYEYRNRRFMFVVGLLQSVRKTEFSYEGASIVILFVAALSALQEFEWDAVLVERLSRDGSSCLSCNSSVSSKAWSWVVFYVIVFVG